MKELKIIGFGETKSGETASLYTLENEAGIAVSVTDYGATLVKLIVPDKEGIPRDIVLGYDEVSEYEKNALFFGATIGRSANRIGGASFELGGNTYKLVKNDNGNNLHSGNDFYNKRLWQASPVNDSALTFRLHSPDGDQGYPGNLDVEVTYMLTEEGELILTYHGVSDKDTIINLTNHSYFNLNGHDSGDILGHEVMLDSDFYTRADGKSIPTGELTDVTGTPMDFRTEKKLGAEIDADYEATKLGGGYDHNWALKNNGNFMKIAKATGEKSGISMEVSTDLPGVQMYTANFVDNEPGKNGTIYGARAAVCFETQYFPDAIHHANFESPVRKAGEVYQTKTAYRFYTAD